MNGEGIYAALMRMSTESLHDSASRHALASIFTIAAEESAGTGSLAAGLGLSGVALCAVIDECFPGARSMLEPLSFDDPLAAGNEERSIGELLRRFATRDSAHAGLFSILIARRAMHPNHLWQDLGLNHRGELSALMNRHFVPLARKNRQDMKWKKFFYRMTCSEDGFTLCAAPVCSECADFDTCFGDESGESLLARNSLRAARKPFVQLLAMPQSSQGAMSGI